MTSTPSPAERLAAQPKPPRKGGPPVPPPQFRHRVASRLRQARLALGLTASAVEAGSRVYGYAAIEGGKNVNLRHALMLAKFFGKPVEELWSLLSEGGDGP